MHKLCLISLLLSTISQCWSYDKCPPENQLMPCKCHHNEMIQCRQPGKYSLSHIFYTISRHYSAGHRHSHHRQRGGQHQTSDRHFREFVLENPSMRVLDANLFGSIRFEKITFVNMLQLRRMNSAVFNGTEPTVKTIIIKGPNQLGIKYVSELFDALSSLVAVREMHLELENLSYLPNTLVRSLDKSVTPKLEILRIITRSLPQIPSYAFYDLINIRDIHIFSQTGINHISGHAFNMVNKSDEVLNIDLQNNQLTNSLFEIDSFAGVQRPVNLLLSFNNLTTLSEKTFKKFLNANHVNRLFVKGNPFECDCGMAWLMVNRTQYLEQVQDAVCDTYAPLWRLDDIHFQKCGQNTQYMPRLLFRNSANRYLIFADLSKIIMTAMMTITMFIAINNL